MSGFYISHIRIFKCILGSFSKAYKPERCKEKSKWSAPRLETSRKNLEIRSENKHRTRTEKSAGIGVGNSGE